MRDKRLYQKTAGICDMMVLEQLARKKDVSMVKILLLCMLNYECYANERMFLSDFC